MVERTGKRDGECVARARTWRRDAPRREVDALFDRGTGAELISEWFCEWQAVRVPPRRVDDERINAAGFERASHLLVGKNAAFDASGIQKKCVTGVVGI